MKLEEGKIYMVENLQFSTWSNPNLENTEGYNVGDYFLPDGEYLGPDDLGIEPEFKDSETGWYTIHCSQHSAEFLGEAWGVRYASLDEAKDIAIDLENNLDEYGLPKETIYTVCDENGNTVWSTAE